MAKKKGKIQRTPVRKQEPKPATPTAPIAVKRKAKPTPTPTPTPEAASTPGDTAGKPLIVKTRADVARELKQRIGKGSVRSLADWFKMGCPDCPGAYNVDEIEAWVRDNVGTEETDEQSERAYWETFKVREQALKAQAERLQVEGALVEAAIVDMTIERLANTLNTMLGQWPDWILSLLPTNLKPAQRADIRKAVARKVDELGTMAADILEEWAGTNSTEDSAAD